MTTMSHPQPGPVPRRTDPDVYPVLTVLLLMLGGFALPVVGWLAGVVMLWAGREWSIGQKWLGTLVWPAVIAVPAAALLVGSLAGGSHGPVVVGLAVGAVVALVALPWTFVRLLRGARG